jgi:hypothetical protein
LKDDPAGSTRAADEAIVDGALTALLVPHGTGPELHGKGFVSSGIVAGGPGYGGGGFAILFYWVFKKYHWCQYQHCV